MLLTGLIMFGLFALSGGALVLALMLTRRRRIEIERRLRVAAGAPTADPGRSDLWQRSRGQTWDSRVRRAFTLGHAYSWGMTSGGAGLMTAAAGSGAVAMFVADALLIWPTWISGLIAIAAAYLLPRTILLRQQRKAEQQFTDLFPDAVVAISRMLRAGLPITTAVRSVSRESPPPVSTVFSTISDQVDIGSPIEDALDASSRHVGLPDFRFFTVAIVLQHLTGGNLAATLEILADIIRRRRAVRLKARATTAEIRMSAYVLAGIPFLVIGALMLIQPGYLAPLITDPRGHFILLAAVISLGAGALTMRQMMRSVTTL
jgi:tight adherence protein B